MNSRVSFDCEICKKEKIVWRNDFLKATHHFCGDKCRLYWRNHISNPDYLPHVRTIFSKKYKDSGNPNWKGGCGEWMASKYKREGKYQRCAYCNKTKKECKLQLHHIDKNRWNNKPSNLKILCLSCHKRMDIGLIQP
jgi:hypothetical protein